MITMSNLEDAHLSGFFFASELDEYLKPFEVPTIDTRYEKQFFTGKQVAFRNGVRVAEAHTIHILDENEPKIVEMFNLDEVAGRYADYPGRRRGFVYNYMNALRYSIDDGKMKNMVFETANGSFDWYDVGALRTNTSIKIMPIEPPFEMDVAEAYQESAMAALKKYLEEHVNWDQLFMFINEKSKTKDEDDYDPSCEEIDIP